MSRLRLICPNEKYNYTKLLYSKTVQYRKNQTLLKSQETEPRENKKQEAQIMPQITSQKLSKTPKFKNMVKLKNYIKSKKKHTVVRKKHRRAYTAMKTQRKNKQIQMKKIPQKFRNSQRFLTPKGNIGARQTQKSTTGFKYKSTSQRERQPYSPFHQRSTSYSQHRAKYRKLYRKIKSVQKVSKLTTPRAEINKSEEEEKGSLTNEETTNIFDHIKNASQLLKFRAIENTASQLDQEQRQLKQKFNSLQHRVNNVLVNDQASLSLIQKRKSQPFLSTKRYKEIHDLQPIDGTFSFLCLFNRAKRWRNTRI